MQKNPQNTWRLSLVVSQQYPIKLIWHGTRISIKHDYFFSNVQTNIWVQTYQLIELMSSLELTSTYFWCLLFLTRFFLPHSLYMSFFRLVFCSLFCLFVLKFHWNFYPYQMDTIVYVVWSACLRAMWYLFFSCVRTHNIYSCWWNVIRIALNAGPISSDICSVCLCAIFQCPRVSFKFLWMLSEFKWRSNGVCVMCMEETSDI